MPLFVVTAHHIDVIVSAALEAGIAARFSPGQYPVPVTHETGGLFGRMLWTENIRSVIGHHRLQGTAQAARYQAEVNNYRFRYHATIRPSAAARALACLEEQSRQAPGHDTGVAARFADRLARALLHGLPDQELEAWHIGTVQMARLAGEPQPLRVVAGGRA